MQLEDYFLILAPDDIRLRGTRVGIESILDEYLERQRTPEAIAARFPTLTLDQVYATILYYLRNQDSIRAYLADWREHGQRMWEEQWRDPAPALARLRELKRLRCLATPKPE